MKKKATFFSKHAMIAVGLLALPSTLKLEKAAVARPAESAKPTQPPAPDPRTDRLKRFLSYLHCPVASLSEEFVHAADDNQLDWRLLPSISVVESGGGKAYRNNNIFGWDNGTQLFPTIRSGIHEVAYKLGKSALYRNRDVIGKLHLYNPDSTYADRVLSVMRRISPVVNLQPASRLIRRNHEFVYASD
ncbi:MAG TPA: hypothetical protein VFA65_18400 [Bryobacteraceae bacterium]|nr:hypothetical protein [Bryobacteraceae bacterium]